MLPPETNRVWEYLQHREELAGHVLIGGSALAMHIGHRVSEDLDFAYPALRLPREPLARLVAAAAQAGFNFVRNDNQAAYEEFLIAGNDLHNYQQDFIVNGMVKVTFVAVDDPVAALLGGKPGATLRVATVREIFEMKCHVSASRSKTRDWFDLYVLLRERGFTIQQFREVFIKSGRGLSEFENAISRLCSGIPQQSDEGFRHLAPNPPTVEQMRDFFRAERDILEVELAAEAKRAQQAGENQLGEK